MSTQNHQLPTTNTDGVPAHTQPPHANPPTENPGGLRTLAIIVAVVLLLAVVYGLHVRSASEKRLTVATDEAAIPTVSVDASGGGNQGR